MAKPPGFREADRIREAEVDDVEALVRMREEMTTLVVDDANLGQNVAGEVADHIGVKRLELRRDCLRRPSHP